MNRTELENLSNNIIREETKKILNIYTEYGMDSIQAKEQEQIAIKNYCSGDKFIQLAKKIYKEENNRF